MQNKEKGIMPVIILVVIAFISALALSVTHYISQPIIDANEVIKADELKQEVLPAADKFVAIELAEYDSPLAVINEVYEAKKGDESVGYVFNVTTKGFGGDVVLFIGIDNEGTFTNIKVSSHNETPGLGAKIETDEFNNKISGKKAENMLSVVKVPTTDEDKISAISGATISSRAICSALNCVIDYKTEELGGE